MEDSSSERRRQFFLCDFILLSFFEEGPSGHIDHALRHRPYADGHHAKSGPGLSKRAAEKKRLLPRGLSFSDFHPAAWQGLFYLLHTAYRPAGSWKIIWKLSPDACTGFDRILCPCLQLLTVRHSPVSVFVGSVTNDPLFFFQIRQYPLYLPLCQPK